MYQKSLSIFILLLIKCLPLFSQNPPEVFFTALQHLTTDPNLAKTELIAAIKVEPAFHGSYHFLGTIYLDEQKPDSAALYLRKSIDLNKTNVAKTQEMSYARLITAQTLSFDFNSAYQTGLEASQLYPENRLISLYFKDACLWSYYLKYTGLDKSYLSSTAKEEYMVTSIPQEYLITRIIRINNDPIQVAGQQTAEIRKKTYDLLSFVVKGKKADTPLKFQINWDMLTEMGGRPGPTANVIANVKLPIYERLGATLVQNSKADLKTEIEKLSLK